MLSILHKLMSDNGGATAIEYLIVALNTVAAITAMGTVGSKVSNVLSNAANAMT